MTSNDADSGNETDTGPRYAPDQAKHAPGNRVTGWRRLDPGVLILLIGGSLVAVTGCILLALADGTEPWTFLYLLPTVAGLFLICAAFSWGADLAKR